MLSKLHKRCLKSFKLNKIYQTAFFVSWNRTNYWPRTTWYLRTMSKVSSPLNWPSRLNYRFTIWVFVIATFKRQLYSYQRFINCVNSMSSLTSSSKIFLRYSVQAMWKHLCKSRFSNKWLQIYKVCKTTKKQ